MTTILVLAAALYLGSIFSEQVLAFVAYVRNLFRK